MTIAHWSWCGHSVKVGGVNAACSIPLLLWIIYPPFLGTLFLFLITMTFFVVIENFLNMRPIYVLDAIRYWLMGPTKTPRTKDFDI